jgi:hypothetical protein
MRTLAACGLLAAAALPYPLLAQNAAPKDSTGKMAPSGTAVAPSRATSDGGRKPPTDATGQVAPAGTPAAPSRLAAPNGTTAPSSTTRQ